MNLFLLYTILFISIYYYHNNFTEYFGIGGSFKKVGSEIKDVGEKGVDGAKDVGEKGIDGAKDIAEDGIEGVKDVADKAGDALDPMEQIMKKIRDFFKKFGLYAILILCCPCITFLTIGILLLFISGMMFLISGKGLSIFSRNR